MKLQMDRKKPNRKIFRFLLITLFLMLFAGVDTGFALENELTDSNIRDAVENEILFDPAVSLNNLDVTVENGIVTLSKTASHLLARQRAVKISETVKGVRSTE